MGDTNLTGIALCGGVGGLELGLQFALPSYRCCCYVEWEAFAASVLMARMEESALEPAPIFAGDLREFAERHASAFAGVDLVSAGFPCQPFSSAGKQQGVEDERWLWPDIERILREVQPRWVVLENVPGLVRHGLGPVLGGLASLGYDAEWDLFSAEDVGAPHRRQRFFLLARRVSDAVGDPLREQPERGAGRAQAPDERDAEPRDLVEDMADSDGGRQQGERQQERAGLQGEPGREPDGRGADRGLLGAPVGSGDGSRKDARPEAGASGEGRGAVSEPSGELADAGREHAQGRHVDRATQGREDRAGLPAGRRLFPPGPAALDLWARVLAETPEVEPSLCRMSDGVADALEFRSDRLRVCGNGVVPLQAAHAVLALADRAGWLDQLVHDGLTE